MAATRLPSAAGTANADAPTGPAAKRLTGSAAGGCSRESPSLATSTPSRKVRRTAKPTRSSTTTKSAGSPTRSKPTGRP